MMYIVCYFRFMSLCFNLTLSLALIIRWIFLFFLHFCLLLLLLFIYFFFLNIILFYCHIPFFALSLLSTELSTVFVWLDVVRFANNRFIFVLQYVHVLLHRVERRELEWAQSTQYILHRNGYWNEKRFELSENWKIFLFLFSHFFNTKTNLTTTHFYYVVYEIRLPHSMLYCFFVSRCKNGLFLRVLLNAVVVGVIVAGTSFMSFCKIHISMHL